MLRFPHVSSAPVALHAACTSLPLLPKHFTPLAAVTQQPDAVTATCDTSSSVSVVRCRQIQLAPTQPVQNTCAPSSTHVMLEPAHTRTASHGCHTSCHAPCVTLRINWHSVDAPRQNICPIASSTHTWTLPPATPRNGNRAAAGSLGAGASAHGGTRTHHMLPSAPRRVNTPGSCPAANSALVSPSNVNGAPHARAAPRTRWPVSSTSCAAL